jgi:uncharacterized cupredoxin-like copper-binding protein
VIRILGTLAVVMVSAACLSSGSADAPPTEATIAIRYSHFEPEVVEVAAGEPVTITLVNDDPIEHEWIVGPAEVHDVHRTGTEPFHDTRPNEVTIPALSERTTTLTFDDATEYAFICHLPGHEAYGMTGTLRIVER